MPDSPPPDSEQDEASLDGFAVPSSVSTNAGRDRLELLVSEFLERQRRGENVGVDEYVRKNPDLKQEILDLLPMVAVMEQWKGRKESEILRQRVSVDLQIGQIGRCRIVRPLGHGGMGIVYEAEHEIRGRVAVKLLPWRFADKLSFRRKFDEEIQTATKLQHANIVSVLEYGEHDGFYYYVMPFVEGASLDWIIRRLQENEAGLDGDEISRLHSRTTEAGFADDGPAITLHFGRSEAEPPEPFFAIRGTTSPEGERRLTRDSWRLFARIILQAAEALRYAHGQGTAHCDVKPGNLLLDRSGRLWITDFGLARTIGDEGGTDRSGDVGGTLRYMAPERYRGQTDARCDIYSLGMTLYELLTIGSEDPAAASSAAFGPGGRGSSSSGTFSVAAAEIELPRSLNPAIPRDLEAIVLQAVQPDFQQRYQTAGELVADLLRFLNDEPVRARRPGAWRRLKGWYRRQDRRRGADGRTD